MAEQSRLYFLILHVFGQRSLFGNRPGHFGEQDWAWSPLGHFRLKPPANNRLSVEQISRWVHHGTSPVFFPNHADLGAQHLLGIANQAKRECAPRLLPEGIVILVSHLVELCVANNPLAQLPAVLSRLGADSVNGDVILLVSAVLIDEGLNLGPTPRSPLTAVEKNDRSRRRAQNRWEYNRVSIDILQGRLRKSCSNI